MPSIAERETGVYAFSHLTLQEYLVAFHARNPKRWRGLVEREIANIRFREVFLLLSGLTVDVNEYLEALAAKVSSFAGDERLTIFLSWAVITQNSV